jgi:hypothetical protein
MLNWSRLVHLFSFGLLTGFLAITEWSLIPAQNRLPASGYAMLEQGMNDVLETLTATLMIVSVLSALVVLLLARRDGARVVTLQVITLGSIVTMVVSTLIINAPVNFEIDTWNAAAPPADWASWRDRWEFGHALRSYVGLVGLLTALVAALWPNRGGRSEPATTT